MSILIKGMEMPKNCWYCSFEHECYCMATKRLLELADVHKTAERPNGCPLIELPPHGRLIDADEFLEWYSSEGFDIDEEEWEKMHVTIGTLRANIADAPTVIEAEEVSEWEEPEINPCRGCMDYDGNGGCKSNGGCGREGVSE